VGPQHLLLTLSPPLQAIRGEAFDRHLLGLKLQAIEDLVSMPDIFMDTSYAIAMHFNLSTSQVGHCPSCPEDRKKRPTGTWTLGVKQST
jgi:hypothetical protein